MSYAVKIGTTQAQWIDGGPLPDGCVRYVGDLSPDLVWGNDVQTLRLPTAAERQAAARQQRRAAVNAEWSRRKDAGFTWRGKRIDSDPTSRENIVNVAMAASAMLISGTPSTTVIRPAGWKAADNTFTAPVTLADALNLHGTMIQAGTALFDYAQILKSQIDASDTPESIDITAGWPE